MDPGESLEKFPKERSPRMRQLFALVLALGCLAPVSALAGRKITTLAGLGTPEKPHPIQTAWLEEQVSQCAYCISGWILTAAELIDRNPKPTDEQIRTELGPHLCRCGTHMRILRAVHRAARLMDTAALAPAVERSAQ